METWYPQNEKNIVKKIALKSRIVVCTNLLPKIMIHLLVPPRYKGNAYKGEPNVKLDITNYSPSSRFASM